MSNTQRNTSSLSSGIAPTFTITFEKLIVIAISTSTLLHETHRWTPNVERIGRNLSAPSFNSTSHPINPPPLQLPLSAAHPAVELHIRNYFAVCASVSEYYRVGVSKIQSGKRLVEEHRHHSSYNSSSSEKALYWGARGKPVVASKIQGPRPSKTVVQLQS
eukprot:scaffold41013_cov250-Skeletonema_dohrnii-CCMP3373.AAC.4